jgi:hypothetical protein
MAEYNGLTFAPVLVIDLNSVFGCNRRHDDSPFVFKSAGKLWIVREYRGKAVWTRLMATTPISAFET